MRVSCSIIEEPPAFARLEVFGRKDRAAMFRSIPARGFRRDRQTTDQNNAIALKRVDLFLCDAAWHTVSFGVGHWIPSP
jgi:hypothetical protein